jgi:hypothetical protein
MQFALIFGFFSQKLNETEREKNEINLFYNLGLKRSLECYHLCPPIHFF